MHFFLPFNILDLPLMSYMRLELCRSIHNRFSTLEHTLHRALKASLFIFFIFFSYYFCFIFLLFWQNNSCLAYLFFLSSIFDFDLHLQHAQLFLLLFRFVLVFFYCCLLLNFFFFQKLFPLFVSFYLLFVQFFFCFLVVLIHIQSLLNQVLIPLQLVNKLIQIFFNNN